MKMNVNPLDVKTDSVTVVVTIKRCDLNYFTLDASTFTQIDLKQGDTSLLEMPTW